MSFDRADDLVAELSFLRKNDGFVQRRLERTPMVDETLRQNREDSFERLRSRFVSAICTQPMQDSALLLDIFGLSPETEGIALLRDRRAVQAARIHRGLETVASRETASLSQLASTLIRGTYAQSPLTIDVPEMHDGIIYETTSTLIVVENRRWKESWEHYRFVATFDEMDYLTISRSYAGMITADPAGRFQVRTRPVSRGVDDDFWHLDAARKNAEPMRRGQQYDIRFRLQPDAGGRQSSMTVASRGFHERALLSSMRVRFLGEHPSTIWRHERISYVAVPGEEAESVREHIDDNHEVVLRQRNVHGGLFSGFGWKWGKR